MRNPIRTIAAALVLFMMAAAVAGADDGPAAPSPTTQPQPPSRPPLTAGVQIAAVRTIEATYNRPKLIGLTITGKPGDPGRLVLNRDGRRVIMPSDHVVRIHVHSPPDREQSPSDRMPDNATAVLLTDGEWLAGLVRGGDERRVLVSVVGLGEIPVPLRRVRGLVAPLGRVGRNLAQLERSLLSEKPDRPRETQGGANDTLQLANGETISGTVVTIDEKGLTVQGPLGAVTVKLDVLTVAWLVNPLPSRPADPPVAAWVELVNGSRLLASRLSWSAHTIRVTRPGGGRAMLIPDEQVAAVEILNGRWRWLDLQTPLLAEHNPFLTIRWPARFGVNAVGGPIRIGEKPYRHGIGVHSSSRLVFAIEKASRFHCLAGLDAAAGPLADVDVQVLLDGQVKYQKKSVTLSDGAIPINLDVRGAQKLELRVDFGANGDVQDRFDWADAALIR